MQNLIKKQQWNEYNLKNEYLFFGIKNLICYISSFPECQQSIQGFVVLAVRALYKTSERVNFFLVGLSWTPLIFNQSVTWWRWKLCRSPAGGRTPLLLVSGNVAKCQRKAAQPPNFSSQLWSVCLKNAARFGAVKMWAAESPGCS